MQNSPRTDSKKKISRDAEQKQVNCKMKNIYFPSQFATTFHCLHQLQKQGRLCDIELVSREGSVLAHSLVLRASSDYFSCLIDKNKTSANTTMLDLVNVPVWVIQKLVDFLYTGHIHFEEDDTECLAKYCEEFQLYDLHDKVKNGSISGLKECLLGEIISKFNIVKRTLKYTRRTNKDMRSDRSALEELITLVQSTNSSSAYQFNRNSQEIGDSSKTIIKSQYMSSSVQSKVVQSSKRKNKRTANSSSKSIANSEVIVDLKTVKSNDKENTHERIGHQPDLPVDREHGKDRPLNESGSNMVVNDSVDDIKDADDSASDCSENLSPSDNASGEISYDSQTSPATSPKKQKLDIITNSDSKKPKSVSKLDTQTNKCRRCDATFESKEEAQKHLKECKVNKPRRRCILCKISFESCEEYVQHRKTDPTCLAIRKGKHEQRLKRKAQLRSRFSCRVCPRKFRRVADHIDHEFVAHDLPYDKEKWPDLFCEWCNYWTMNPWRLHHHKTYDCSKGQEFICDVCGNKYKNEKTLKCHREMMHTDAVPMMTCGQCGKSLKGPKGLEHHIRLMHKGENPHKRHMCHICSMKYTSSNDLSFHLYRVHEQPLPDGFVVYECSKCDYIINNKRTYDKHMQLHEDKRDWKCDMCPKAFKTKNSLHTHMKSHIGKKIPCPYDGCSYSSLKKCHLKTHIENQHTQKGVKNEQCHVCSYSTFFKGNLIKHLRTVHQLEVVTRYSVQMKAKYKNLKNGQIIGQVISDNQTPNESAATQLSHSGMSDENNDTRQLPVDSQTVSTRQHSVDSQTVSTRQHSVDSQAVPVSSVLTSQQYVNIKDGVAVTSATVGAEVESHVRDTSAKFTVMASNVQPAEASYHTTLQPSSTFAYAMGPSDIAGSVETVPSSMGLMFTDSGQDFNLSQPQLSHSGHDGREVTMSSSGMYMGRSGDGVMAPSLFGGHDTEESGSKIMTYYQM